MFPEQLRVNLSAQSQCWFAICVFILGFLVCEGCGGSGLEGHMFSCAEPKRVTTSFLHLSFWDLWPLCWHKNGNQLLSCWSEASGWKTQTPQKKNGVKSGADCQRDGGGLNSLFLWKSMILFPLLTPWQGHLYMWVPTVEFLFLYITTQPLEIHMPTLNLLWAPKNE